MNPRQEAFCVEYVRSGNAAKAYRAAGYKTVNPHSADVRASALLKKPDIAERVRELVVEMKGEEILDAKQRRIVLSDIARTSKNTMEVIRAIDVLNRMDGVYVQKQQITGADGNPLRISWEGESDPETLEETLVRRREKAKAAAGEDP